MAARHTTSRSRWRHALYLYWRLMTQHLKAILEYQADFVIAIGASVLTQLLGFIFLWVLYRYIPQIDGWHFWEVAFIYAMIFISEGFASLFFEGTWMLGTLVTRGELDRYLLRPLPALLQVLASGIGINGIGNITVGSVILAQALYHSSINWTPQNVLYLAAALLSAVLIRTSINIASSASVFWTNTERNALPFMVHSMAEFSKYPITIFSRSTQMIVAVLIPYGFISFFPATYLFEKPYLAGFGLLVPVVAVGSFGLACLIFSIGLRRYESVGH